MKFPAQTSVALSPYRRGRLGFLLLPSLTVASLLLGCGQKGPLYLPDPVAASASDKPIPPSPSSAAPTAPAPTTRP